MKKDYDQLALILTILLSTLLALLTLYFFPDEMSKALCGQGVINYLSILALVCLLVFELSFYGIGFIIRKILGL